MNKTVEMLKKMHNAQMIERKDISLQDLVNQEGKAGELTTEVVGFASKLVPKYKNDDNQGYHTTVYLKDGRITGAFSNALHEFANFFYEKAGLDIDQTFNKVTFPNGSLKLKISVVKLDAKKSTYNFEIVDGEITGIERNNGLGQVSNLLPESQELKAIEA